MQLEEEEEEALGAQFHAELRRVNRAHEEQRISMRQQHHHERVAAQAPPLPPRRPDQVVGEQLAEVDWEAVLDKVGNKCNKLSRMSLSAFGRAFGVSGYALSPLLFYADFSSLPQHIARHAHRLAAATVDGNTRGDRRSKGGVPSALQVGSPREGGLGLLPWAQHITARHARWAQILVHHLNQPTPVNNTPPWVLAATTILQARGHPSPTNLLPPYNPNLKQPPLPPPLK